MKLPVRYSLRTCLILTLVIAIPVWWSTLGEPYTDVFARIVRYRLDARMPVDSPEDGTTSAALLDEVGIAIERLEVEESVQFASGTSITLYRLSPSYLLRVEQAADGDRVYVYDAELILNRIPSGDG